MVIDPTKRSNMDTHLLSESKAAANKRKCRNAVFKTGIAITMLAAIAAVALPLLMSFGLIPAAFILPLFIGAVVLAATGVSLFVACAKGRHQAKAPLPNKVTDLSKLGASNV